MDKKAQAVEPEVAAIVSRAIHSESELSYLDPAVPDGEELITRKSHCDAMEAQRKAMEFEAWEYRERIVPELRAALQSCMVALGTCVSRRLPFHYIEQEFDEHKVCAAITQAQEALK